MLYLVLRLDKSLRICTKKTDFAAVVILCSNLSSDFDLISYNIWSSQLYSVIHDMKNWPAPLLVSRVHYFYGKLSQNGMLDIVSFLNQIKKSFWPTRLRLDSVLQNEFISLWTLYESCRPIHIDEFMFLNLLISISKV